MFLGENLQIKGKVKIKKMTRKLNIEDIILFFIFWIVTSIIWAIWLNGILVPITGFGSAVIFMIMSDLLNFIDKK